MPDCSTVPQDWKSRRNREERGTFWRDILVKINLFVCVSDLEFQTSQQIVCRIFDVHIYLMDIF